VRFGDRDEVTNAVLDSVQRDGTCWLSGSTFRDQAIMRVSVVNWQTTEDDVRRSAAAILAAARALSTTA
jgi:hypothetical protein